MNWIEKTTKDLETMLENGEPQNQVLAFARGKLLESYKNGASAERRKAKTKTV